jgi:hypothetical protein
VGSDQNPSPRTRYGENRRASVTAIEMIELLSWLRQSFVDCKQISYKYALGCVS